MPKQDRAAQIQKEAKKTQGKIARDKKSSEEEAAAEEEAAKAAAAAATSKALGSRKAAAPAGTFAKAAAAAAQMESDDEDDEPAQRQAPTVAETKKKEAVAPEKKKSKAQERRDEMQMLADEQREAVKRRIIERLSHIFMFGLLSKDKNDSGKANGGKPDKAKVTNSGKKKAKVNDDEGFNVASLKDKMAYVFNGPMLVLAFVGVMLAVRALGEGYSPDARQDGVNFYDIMGIPRGSDMLEVRKAYKSLALTWHPDKHPDCKECPDRFGQISEAYDTLSNVEKKKAYDNHRAPKGSLEASSSLEITGENFESNVLRSDDVWLVEVFNPNDGMCKSFHPIWEEVSASMESVAKFGRIDATKQKRALDMLPQRIVIFPVILRYARGMPPETWSPSMNMEPSPKEFVRFIQDNYPEPPRFESASALKAFMGSSGPKILFSGPLAGQMRGDRLNEYLHFVRIAVTWSQLVTFGIADREVTDETFGRRPSGRSGGGFTLTYASGSEAPTTKDVAVLGDAAADAKELVQKAVGSTAPSLTVRNYRSLCGNGGLSVASRSFCLVVVDGDDAGLRSILSDLNASRAAYAQEVADLKATADDEGVGEELFHIQPVRISTSTSRLPSRPSGAGPGFAALWAEAKYASMFVLELETRRVAVVKKSNLKDIFQGIAYDDIKFSELPEEVSLTRSLPDPETSIKRELVSALHTLVGMLVAFLFMVVGVAVVPELSPKQMGIAVGPLLLVLMVIWPGFCRRFLGLFGL